jgi:CSLREA domain-containing protein
VNKEGKMRGAASTYGSVTGTITRLSVVKLLAAAVCAVAITLMGAGAASAATFIVTGFDDVDDGTCNQSHCSLREAIAAANAETGPDRILVNDDEPITPATPLPFITDAVYLRSFADGRCANDSAPLILDGGGADFSGLMFMSGSDGSHVCGINVRGFTHGIQFISSENAIRQSVIGTTLDGQTADPNSDAGIVVAGDNNLIGGERGIRTNLISGNGLYGVLVNRATGTRIEGNLIGTDWSSTEAVPNEVGIYVDVSSDTTIGGTPEQGNVISGNTDTGVVTGDGRIVGNLIGTDEGGTEPVPNGDAGVFAFEPVQIGGPFPEERNVISGNGRADVVLAAAARVEGNWIGPAADGSTLDDHLGTGVEVEAGANGAVIGDEDAGNVIAGHDTGILAAAPLSGIEIKGNLLGLAPDGTTPIRTNDGIVLGHEVSGAEIGGSIPGGGNTVAAHEVYGLQVYGDRTRIEGNTMGLDEAGAVAGNSGGVYVGNTAEGTAIGAEGDGAGNTISGNGTGVLLAAGSTGTMVLGNRIGTDPTGTGERGNGDGIVVDGDAHIGGSAPGRRNVISANDAAGVLVRSPSARATIEGNLIGLAADGATALGNQGAGIEVDSAAEVAIGGAGSGAGNRIAHNAGDGVRVRVANGALIQANEIFANGPGAPDELGIDLLDDGVTANDVGDNDGLPNFPVITRIEASGTGSTVAGTIDGVAGHALRIELFSSPSCDEAGYGQGQTVLGAVTVTAAAGPTAFSAAVAAVPAGHQVTATATDVTTNRTSEFSACGQQPDQPGPIGQPPPSDPPGSGAPTSPPAGPTNPTPPDNQAKIKTCRAPKLKGLRLANARKRIKRAGCRLGNVKRPRHKARKNYRLVVAGTNRKPGSVHPGETTIRLTLKWQRVNSRKR